MLTSIAIIILLGICLGGIFKKLHLPPLIGMILTGIILSPYALDLIDSSILNISSELRKIALIIILTRAGLSLDIDDLKKSGRPAILMCFLPATFEIIGTVLVAPILLGVSHIEAAVIGTVIAAVSPAVVVPRMIKIMNEGYGVKKNIPQIILAGASADDVYVIVLFTSFTALLTGNNVGIFDYIQIPTSIILGIILGLITGLFFNIFFKKVHIRDSAKVLILLSVSFLFTTIETVTENSIRVSGLIAVMALGMTLYKVYPILALRLSSKYNKMWVAAELFLFVLVGASVDLTKAADYGLNAVLLIFAALIFRMAGVFTALLKTNLTIRERLFCMAAYSPKATVQAAIGAIPLSMGLQCGQIVLTVSVLAILITAPLGAILTDSLYKKLLK